LFVGNMASKQLAPEVSRVEDLLLIFPCTGGSLGTKVLGKFAQ